VALLQRLKGAGHRLYYLSNMPRAYAEHLERHNTFIGDFLDGIFSAATSPPPGPMAGRRCTSVVRRRRNASWWTGAG
jgi:hypothetical protein